MTLLDFQLIIIITVTIWVAVFNRFSWNSHSWCELTHGWTLFFSETIGPIEPLICGKMCLQSWFFDFHSAGMGFLEEKISKSYSIPHFQQKRLYSFFSSNGPFPEKWSCPRKIIFHSYFGNFFFNWYIKNIQNLISYKKVYIYFCCQSSSFPQNCHVLPQLVFHYFLT